MSPPAHALAGFLLLALPALAGCLASPQPVAPSALALPVVELGGATDATGAGLAWQGAELAPAPCALPPCGPPACDAANCERVAFRVEVPPGAPARGLKVAVAWPWEGVAFEGLEPSVQFELVVVGPSGAEAARGAGGWFARVALLERAEPGAYEAVVLSTRGGGAYQGSVQLAAAPPAGPVRALLPNLVTLPPRELRLEAPPGFPYGLLLPAGVSGPLASAAARALGAEGCGVDEAAEGGARRCLRFSSAIGNVGEGPLELRLPVAEGPAAVLGQGAFEQRLYRSDGSFEGLAAGSPDFHAVHGHFHLAGFGHFAVHRHDLATGARGEVVSEGRKVGFCLLDVGLATLHHAPTGPARYAIEACEDPAPGAWSMGIMPGWFDLYAWWLPDQYVELTGVEDGVYELVTQANPGAVLAESDAADNEASVVFRLDGSEVEVLAERGYGA